MSTSSPTDLLKIVHGPLSFSYSDIYCFFFFLFLLYISHTESSFSSLLTSQLYTPQLLLHFSSVNGRSPKDIKQTWHLYSCSKTKGLLSYYGWKRQPSKMKRIPKPVKRVRNSSCFHYWESHKKTKLCKHSMYEEVLGLPMQAP